MMPISVIVAGIFSPLLSQFLNQRWLSRKKNYLITALTALVLAVVACLVGGTSLGSTEFVAVYMTVLGMGHAIERLCLEGTKVEDKLLDAFDFKRTKSAKEARDCHEGPVDMNQDD